MKKKYWVIVAVLTAGWLNAAAADNKPLTLHQFEWHQPVNISSKEAIFRFEVPAAVHDGTVRRDLGDVRIFNAAGEIVPHAFLSYEWPEKRMPAVPVKHFPYYYNQKNRQDNIAVYVTKRDDGSLVSTKISASKDQGSPELVGYVLDVSGIKHPITGILAEWPAQQTGTVFRLSVESSNDLKKWDSVMCCEQMVDLNQAGHQLRQNRIELKNVNAKYIRIKHSEKNEGPQITGFSVETAAVKGLPHKTKWTAATVQASEKAGEYQFVSPGIPISGIRIKLPQKNTLAPVKLYQRTKDSEVWREVASSVVYRLNHEWREIESPEIQLPVSNDRQWRMVIDQGSGGIGAGLPKVELGWVPQHGVFVARGEAPFVVAYGSRDAQPNGYTVATLVPGYEAEKFMMLPSAQLGKTHHANPGMSQPAEWIANWRIMALWAILVLSVLGLAFMAWKLLRQMNQSKDQSKTEQ